MRMNKCLKTSSILERERGFTLIELLTTMSIIGILSALASSHFHQYARRALDSRAENDISAAVTAEEAYYVDNESYVDCENLECEHVLPAYLISPDVQVSVTTRDDDLHFDATSSHPGGEKQFAFSSDVGNLTSEPKS